MSLSPDDKPKKRRAFTRRLKAGQTIRFAVNGAIVKAWFDERQRVQVQVIGKNPRVIG